jgi:hypothetical protein
VEDTFIPLACIDVMHEKGEKRSADCGISHYVCLWATRQCVMSADNKFTRPQPALVILQNTND